MMALFYDGTVLHEVIPPRKGQGKLICLYTAWIRNKVF